MSRTKNTVSSLILKRKVQGFVDFSINNAIQYSVDDSDFVQDVLSYIIHKKLVGKGVYSTIWEATNLADPDNKYVAKIAPKKKSKLIDEHYSNCIETLYHVQGHPNIIKLLNHHETNQHYYLFIDYHAPPTITLHEYLEMQLSNGGFPLEDALTIFYQLVSAVSFMHRNGVSHRDLKPDNILINPELCFITIIDFGFASHDSLCQEKLGSPLYMSPEMFNDKSYDPKAADIWSLGVIFFQLVFNIHPFSNSKDLIDLTCATQEAIIIPKFYPTSGLEEGKEVDRIVREILELTLQKDIEKRLNAEALEKKVLDKEYKLLQKEKKIQL